MKRRQVISGLGIGVLSVVAGCSRLTGGGINTASKIPEVNQLEFDILEVETDKPVEEPPQITCTPSDNRVRITGVMYQGRRCDTIAPKSMSLENGEYRLVIAAYDRDESCGDLLVKAEYAVEVEFTEQTPNTVTAVESTDQHGEETQTKDCHVG